MAWLTSRAPAAVRALAYGSAAGLAGAALVGAAAYRYLSAGEAQEGSWKEGWRDALSGRAQPWGAALRARFGAAQPVSSRAAGLGCTGI